MFHHQSHLYPPLIRTACGEGPLDFNQRRFSWLGVHAELASATICVRKLRLLSSGVEVIVIVIPIGLLGFGLRQRARLNKWFFGWCPDATTGQKDAGRKT
jgi:hypothetical protein